MMNNNLYLSTQDAGLKYVLMEKLGSTYNIVSSKDNLEKDSSLDDIVKSDLFYSYFPKSKEYDFKNMFELGYAYGLQKPIILVDDREELSVLYHDGSLNFNNYKSNSDAIKNIKCSYFSFNQSTIDFHEGDKTIYSIGDNILFKNLNNNFNNVKSIGSDIEFDLEEIGNKNGVIVVDSQKNLEQDFIYPFFIGMAKGLGNKNILSFYDLSEYDLPKNSIKPVNGFNGLKKYV
jgi:hypothetical protein